VAGWALVPAAPYRSDHATAGPIQLASEQPPDRGCGPEMLGPELAREPTANALVTTPR